MIGIICRDDERNIAREFFELFKTPWEFYDSKHAYDVVVSTQEGISKSNARLVLLYSSKTTQVDVDSSIKVDSSSCTHVIDSNNEQLPIYRNLVNLYGDCPPLLHTVPDSKVAAVKFIEHQTEIIRVGFDLFDEIAFLLNEGQPVGDAFIPTLDLHVSMLRNWIISTGIPLVEIPAIPSGYKFFVSLTHDVDFVGIRRHKFDHTMWGFVYRAVVSSTVAFLRGRIRFAKLWANWMAVLKLPFVFAGVADDFWEHFDKYTDIENGLSSTFFLIPFKNQAGSHVNNKDLYKRAVKYDVGDIGEQIKHLIKLGFEIGLHGIDAWVSADKGSQEMKRVVEVTGQKEIGVRMHWLCYDHQSPFLLEQAGFGYDATLGYNETIGFRNGTVQVFQPIGAERLLEIPLNIQDTALFFPGRLNLKDADAAQLCNKLMDSAGFHGGVLTASWHERSLEPERLWGDLYKWLLGEFQARGAWIGNASQIVAWFRHRRSIAFRECNLVDGKFVISIVGDAVASDPKMFFRLHLPSRSAGSLPAGCKDNFIDIPWNGEAHLEIPVHEKESG